jgi:hypothetical protein
LGLRSEYYGHCFCIVACDAYIFTNLAQGCARQKHGTARFRAAGIHELGLFVPALVPTLLVIVSTTGFMSLKSAFMASIAALLLSLFLLSFTAGRKIYTSPLRLLVVSTAEMSVGVGVILLKLAIGE